MTLLERLRDWFSWPPLTDSGLFLVLTAAAFALGLWLGLVVSGKMRGE